LRTTNSLADARVHIGSVSVDRQFAAFNLQNHTLVADYDRGYQNFVPGAVSEDRSTYALSAYRGRGRGDQVPG
jgi:hypothetical protein